MRLQVVIALAGVSALATSAAADRRAASWVSVYADDDGLTVVSPQLAVRADVGDEVEVDVGYDVDVISAASVDVVSAASPRGYEEERHGLAVGALWRPRPGEVLQLRYMPSWEPDYRSHGVAVGASREWIDRRLTTSLDATVAFDRVGRSGDDPERWRDLRTVAGRASAGWVFDRRTVGQVAYELQWLDGFQASPYRFVSIAWPDAGDVVSVPEAVPDVRARHAVAVGVRRALTRQWFASGTYRAYADSWSVASHTGDVEVQRAFRGDWLVVGASARAYWQSAADFHRDAYTAATGIVPAYRVVDKMLAPSRSVLVGARVDGRLGHVARLGSVRLTGKLELYDQRFDEFSRLAGRRAIIGSVGLAAEYP